MEHGSMRNWLKTVLFISSFSPVLIIWTFLQWYQNGINIIGMQVLFIGLLLTFIPFLIFAAVKRQGEVFTFTAKKVESTGFLIFIFVASYCLPFLMRYTNWPAEMVWLVIATLMIVLWLVDFMPAHPLLALMGYRFYKVEATNGMVYHVITKFDILSPGSIKSVKKISDSLLVEVR